MNERKWDSVEELFETMNREVEYVILRNYEGFPDSLTISGHEDIDILCSEPQKLVQIMKAQAVLKSRVHYTIQVGERTIPVDIRHIGDGYYDKKWTADMLKKRKSFKDIFYVLDDENYFYSLLYHAMIQKPFFSQEYQERLEILGKRCIDSTCTSNDYSHILNTFLRDKGYKATNTQDPQVFLNFTQIPAQLINRNIIWSIHRAYFEIAAVFKKVSKKLKNRILKILSRIKRRLIKVMGLEK